MRKTLKYYVVGVITPKKAKYYVGLTIPKHYLIYAFRYQIIDELQRDIVAKMPFLCGSVAKDEDKRVIIGISGDFSKTRAEKIYREIEKATKESLKSLGLRPIQDREKSKFVYRREKIVAF